jgi:23S rRNA (pseudouridine1915-N3)-methyltransferase
MQLKVLWPGKTHNLHIRNLQDEYLRKINNMGRCSLIQTKEAKGLPETQADKIKHIEGVDLEKRLNNDHVVCLFDRGREMNSQQFAVFMDRTAMNQPHAISFVAGGFLGLADRILERADTLLSLSRMTLSHEMTRVVLLEQIYRALSILNGRSYAK